jgi:hypothetical protein
MMKRKGTEMSTMSEIHAEVVEMVELCFNYENIIDFMVDAGYPREACRIIIEEIAIDIDARERAAEIAAESYFN